MKKYFLYGLILYSILSCNNNCKDAKSMTVLASSTYQNVDSNVIKTGGVRLIALKNGYHVWTQQIGNSPTKVLLLHGGPGFSSVGFTCFQDFFPTAHIEYILYDQLGCGMSDHPNDTSLWNIPRYVDEIEEVRQALHLDSFYLYGWDFGGQLAQEYAIKYPSHLKGLILSNTDASIPIYIHYTDSLYKVIYNQIKDYDLPKGDKNIYKDGLTYKDTAEMIYYETHICRLKPWPAPVILNYKNISQPVYITMCGSNEYSLRGNTRNWSVLDKIKNIQCPTLILGGKYDETPIYELTEMANAIPHSKLVVFNNSGRWSMYNEQKPYFDTLINFIQHGL